SRNATESSRERTSNGYRPAKRFVSFRRRIPRVRLIALAVSTFSIARPSVSRPGRPPSRCDRRQRRIEGGGGTTSTTVTSLVDTNILVYRFDWRFPDKQRLATDLLRAG